MKKKESRANKGFEDLIGVYTNALSQNSKSISEMLSLLKDKKLSEKSKKELKSIKRELNRIDDSLKDLGDDYYGI